MWYYKASSMSHKKTTDKKMILRSPIRQHNNDEAPQNDDDGQFGRMSPLWPMDDNGSADLRMPTAFQICDETAKIEARRPEKEPGDSQALPFPEKLYDLLETTHNEGHDGIVSWMPSGNGFKIHDRPQFMEKILPRFMGPIKYKSFLKQLNLYNFKRVIQGPGRGAYHHEHLVRGKPRQCSYITRAMGSPIDSSSSWNKGFLVEPTSLEEMMRPGRYAGLSDILIPPEVVEECIAIFGSTSAANSWGEGMTPRQVASNEAQYLSRTPRYK